MKTFLRTKTSLAAVLAVVLAGAGAALAADKLHGSRTAGAGPAGAVSASNQPSGGYGLGYGGFWGSRPHFGGPATRGSGLLGHALGAGLVAASRYLGISESELMTQLASGKTLAQIADATSGKSRDGLIAAMVAAQKQRLDAALDAGQLTDSQAQQLEADVQDRVTAMVDGTGFGGRGGFGGPPPDFDGDGDGGPGGSGGFGGTGGTGGTGTFGGGGGTSPQTTTTPSGTTL
jgi:hypothetical protein